MVRARDGVRVLAGQAVVAATPGAVTLADGETVACDTLLVAVGRTPRTAGLGLEELGIGLTRHGTIAVDAYLQTCHRSIYACGDVAGPFQLTHAAGQQGWHAAFNALFGNLHRLRPQTRAMPAVTFTDPEIARVGLNERQARAARVRYDLTEYDLTDLDRAIADAAGPGFARVLTAPGGDRILGATIAAPRAGEMLAEIVLAMHRKLGLAAVQGAVHAYPTYAEASANAAGLWRAAHAPPWARRLLHGYLRWRLS